MQPRMEPCGTLARRQVLVPWGFSSALLAFTLAILGAEPAHSALSKAKFAPVGSVTVPAPQREMRGVWFATVSNIDWPSTNRLTTAEQKAELIRMLDFAAQHKLNAIFFQIRPACDALYASKLEPWSEYLTGTMGVPPKPFYDPLTFAIQEAHKRGLELHAWFNPYRARHPSARSPISASHISRTKPHLVRTYGRHLWLDPGEKEVQDYSLRVVMDVVDRYDVDGIHFDDYFYPYVERDAQGRELDFPDDPSWKKFGVKTGLGRHDWRRDNVNVFIERVNRSVKQAKPWVKFGVSPFGIWRPGNPPQIQGLDAHSKLYADARKWLANGWLDYSAPQLYWAIDPPAQSFPVLLNWWTEQNAKQKLLWPGLNSVNAGGRWKTDEIVKQIRLTRKNTGASGHIHWNMRRGFMGPSGLANVLVRDVYQQDALVPVTAGGKSGPLPKPKVDVRSTKAGLRASWTNAPKSVKLWALQWRNKGEWHTRILPASQRTFTWPSSRPQTIAVSAVGRYGEIGPSAVLSEAATAK